MKADSRLFFKKICFSAFQANLVKIGLFSIFIPHMKHLAGTFNPEGLLNGARGHVTGRFQAIGKAPFTPFCQAKKKKKRFWSRDGAEEDEDA